MVDPVGGFFTDGRLGVVGDGDAGGGQHRQIVGAVADGNHAVAAKSEFTRASDQFISLGACADDSAVQATREFSVFYLERVGEGVVEAEAPLQAIGEKGKTT